MSAALDAIKDQFQVDRLNLIGQSGGGGIVAAMVNERSDVRCAVAGAAAVGPLYKHGPGYNRYFYDPIRELPDAKVHADLRLFVVSDPSDKHAGGRLPARYAADAAGHGLNVLMVWIRADDENHHNALPYSTLIMQDCVEGASQTEIKSNVEYLIREVENTINTTRKRNGETALPPLVPSAPHPVVDVDDPPELSFVTVGTAPIDAAAFLKQAKDILTTGSESRREIRMRSAVLWQLRSCLKVAYYRLPQPGVLRGGLDGISFWWADMVQPDQLYITLAGGRMDIAVDNYRGPMASDLTRLLVDQEQCFPRGTRFVGKMPPIE